MNEIHRIVRADLAAKYEEITDDIGSGATYDSPS